MLLEIGGYVLDIDVGKTREFYLHAQKITDGCNCQGCRNYVAWAESLCTEPKHVLEQMGIQLEKTPEVYVNCQNEDGSLFYGGFYHLCGKIIRGKDAWVKINENAQHLSEDALVTLADDFRVAFSQEFISLLEPNFPTPAVQMEINANIPFVLPEKCDY